MKIDYRIQAAGLREPLEVFLQLAARKTRLLSKRWDPSRGAPVFTRRGVYTTRGWTEWTQGFQYGIPLLLFDATGDEEFLDYGRGATVAIMASHVTHTGVHDHGFNNISTYGNLWRFLREGTTREPEAARHFYELALKASGAVQAARWTTLHDGTGFIYSFNGPHSLFSDTIRSCRALVLAHLLGHCLLGENDRRISLLQRAVEHMVNTARYNVYFGTGRDAYDVRGRVAHESLFNVNGGQYRCPSTQQGYSPFTTWTRGLAWVILGYAEELECLATLPPAEFEPFGGWERIERVLVEAATAAADYYITETPTDGIPYWDTGAPGLALMPGYRDEPAQVDNSYEPVDSSAAVIAAQGLLRLGRCLGKERGGRKYTQAGLTVARTVFAPPYLSEDPRHQGLILHSVYHRPNGWDYVPRGKKTPQGESSMWGDYHAMELAVYLKRQAEGRDGPVFYGA